MNGWFLKFRESPVENRTWWYKQYQGKAQKGNKGWTMRLFDLLCCSLNYVIDLSISTAKTDQPSMPLVAYRVIETKSVEYSAAIAI